MKTSRGLFFVSLVFFLSSSTNAQLLISQLPKDGTWAKFEYSSTLTRANGNETHGKGHLILKCLGTEHFEMQSYRWIEFEYLIEGKPVAYQQVGKMLVAEKLIGTDDELSTGFKRGWLWIGDMPPEFAVLIEENSEAIEDFKVNMLFELEKNKDRKTIENKTIKTDVGDFECEGWRSVKQHDNKGKSIETVYCNKKSPFGFVAWSLEQKATGDGKEEVHTRSVVMRMKLVEIGDKAKSKFPKLK